MFYSYRGVELQVEANTALVCGGSYPSWRFSASDSFPPPSVVPCQTTTMPGDVRSTVADLQWDTLSPFYLLVAYSSGDVALFDMESHTSLHAFDRQGAGLAARCSALSLHSAR